jgi:ketosteroid isomerase-like protein
MAGVICGQVPMNGAEVNIFYTSVSPGIDATLMVVRTPKCSPRKSQETNMTDPKYKAFTALDPFFDIVQEGLAGEVDGNHYFDTIADNAIFEFRYIFPGWPQKLNGRTALMALYAGYGNNIILHGADALVVHRSQDARVLILEYEVHGRIIRTGASYDNRFISVVTIEDRKVVQWRDYMDSLAAVTALSKT